MYPALIKGLKEAFDFVLSPSNESKALLRHRADQINANKTEVARLFAITNGAIQAVNALFEGGDKNNINGQCDRGRLLCPYCW